MSVYLRLENDACEPKDYYTPPDEESTILDDQHPMPCLLYFEAEGPQDYNCLL